MGFRYAENAEIAIAIVSENDAIGGGGAAAAVVVDVFAVFLPESAGSGLLSCFVLSGTV